MLKSTLSHGIAALGFALLAGTGCSSDPEGSENGAAVLVQTDAGTVLADPSSNAGGSDATADSRTADSRTEVAWILFMREEEKLARDVYRALDGSSRVFANIAASEQQHMDAVQVLLARYGLADPAAGKADGVFADPMLQGLYTALVQQGGASLVEAWKVGAEIEELDLADLTQARQSVTHADVAVVFDNLAKGSRNHLRTFDAQLRALGVSYTPKHLDAAEYARIATSPRERGPSQ